MVDTEMMQKYGYGLFSNPSKYSRYSTGRKIPVSPFAKPSIDTSGRPHPRSNMMSTGNPMSPAVRSPMSVTYSSDGSLPSPGGSSVGSPTSHSPAVSPAGSPAVSPMPKYLMPRSLKKAEAPRFLPSYVTQDKMCLRYYCYFRESVYESALERSRVRQCIILYYPTDNSIKIQEPRSTNSGMPQGTLVKKHQVTKPGSTTGETYSYSDIAVGQNIVIYGRAFRVVDADAFTRKWLAARGFELAPPEALPSDALTEVRDAVKTQVQQAELGPDDNGGRVKGNLKEFHAKDRKVLRFYCDWDNRETDGGVVQHFTLYYYLSDDTVAITEEMPPNCGRDPSPLFLKRQRLPKDWRADGSQNANVSHLARRFYVSANDLDVGNELVVYGRRLRLYGCDPFSRRWFQVLGVDRKPDVPRLTASSEPIRWRRLPAPYTEATIGSEQDSLMSCLMLNPRAPKPSPTALDTRMLRFAAVFQHKRASELVRRFIVSLFLSDATLQVHEQTEKNSGTAGGRFLSRGIYKGDNNQPISVQDVYVGACVRINAHDFVIVDADERTLQIMEDMRVPRCDPEVVKAKVASLLTMNQVTELKIRLEEMGGSGSGGCSGGSGSGAGGGSGRGGVGLSATSLRGLLQEFMPRKEWTVQETITLFRALDPNRFGTVEPSAIAALLPSSPRQ